MKRRTSRQEATIPLPLEVMKTHLGFMLVSATISSAILTGCGFDSIGGPGDSCTLEARSSVTVKVVDSAGVVISDAMVTFSVDGGGPQACEVFPDGQGYVCGYEVDGNFTITATKGMDTKTAMVTVKMTADVCHVESQSLTITLGG